VTDDWANADVEGFKIAGARKARRKAKQAAKKSPDAKQPAQMAIGFNQMSDGDKLAEVKKELKEVLELIRGLSIESKPAKKMKGKA